ncbi:hypothetical protein Tco_0769227 [Tanacetum coccineum]|uniref:Uncharacterized protein n=1 Tax=Tanacetum coccineum TaxID=301880 RepID=A0ABQ4ZAK2_9ASTR
MPYPRFTKLIINHFISQHKSLSKLKHTYINTIKDDGVLNRLKFIRTGKDFQEYGQAIPYTMLTEEIKRLETYQTFLAMSTGLIPPKKTRDVALELGKSISKMEADIAEEARRVHETHEHIVIENPTGVDESDESNGEPANRPSGRRRPYSVTFKDTSSVSKKKSLERKEAFKIQQLTRDSSEGAGITPEVPEELIGKTSSEGAGTEPEVPDEGKGSPATKVGVEIDWGSKDDNYQSDEEDVNVHDITWLSTGEQEKAKGDDDRSIDIEETDDERTNSENGDQAMTDAKKNVAKKVEEEKGDEEEERADDDQDQEDQVEDDITSSSKSLKESILDSATKDVHAIKYKLSKAKERCMAYFRSLHLHLQVLSKEDLKGTRIKHGFKWAFMLLFGQEVDTFISTMLLNLDQLQKQLDKDEFQEYGSMAAFWVYDRRVNKIQLMMQESKIDTGKAVDADLVVTKSSGTKSEVQDDNIRLVNDTDADDADIRPIYDEESMAEYPKQRQVKSIMLDSSPDNTTTDYSKQSLESENILLKNTVAQFQKDFSRMEAHCIALELKYQNQALKSGQHGQILNETSNKAKIKKEIDVLEIMNIELDHTQIKEKVFAIAALKNDLRKLKGNSVDTKFAKTSVLGKPVLQSLRKQSVVRQPNAFKSERPQMSKPRFASQVDVNNNLSRPVTQHYLPKRRESIFAKPDHMIASSESRNSSKNMPRFSLNDMVHNHYLDEARKKTQERDRNLKTSVMSSVRFQSTIDGSKPKPRSTNHSTRSMPVYKSSCLTITVVPKADHSKSSSSFLDSKHFVCSTFHKRVFNANHDSCITKLLKELNSHAKIHSYTTSNSNKPVDQKSHTQKPSRQIFTRHRFSPNKTSDVYEKTSPRSYLRWKPTCRIFKTVGLKWVPTGKLFASCTSKDDSEPTHGSNVDIPNIHECKQTLDLSADASDRRQQQPDSISSTSTLATTVTADGNFDL